MSNRTKSHQEDSKNSPLSTKESSKSVVGDARANNEPAPKGRLDDTAEMFQGLITGDDHYHSRGSSSVGLW
jgi:hypothetical protein